MSLAPVIYRRSTLPTPLFAALSATLALASPLALAAPATWIVDSCSEAATTSGDHIGTLRYALNNAASGDTIDMTQIGAPVCSVISLTTGALSITQDTLFVYGPGQDKLAIDAGLAGDRVIDHTGSGTLYLSGLTLKNGTASDAVVTVYGGCIRSSGAVSTSHSTIYGCTVTAGGAGNLASGGGIFALHGVVLNHAVVRNNLAEAPAGGFAQGGGIGVSTAGTFAASYSTIAYNQASSSTANRGLGGGMFVRGGATITNSTISGNTSNGQMGGFRISGSATSRTVLITNSTISGNSTMGSYSGGSISGANTTIANVTVAFNHSNDINAGNPLTAGLVVNGSSSYSIDVQSTIASANTFGAGANDLFLFNGTVSGANNIATAVYDNLAFPGTVNVCALLGPLRDNGGPTKTHALQSTSPAIDQGNNAIASAADQRALPYARVSGIEADIGAYEMQQEEIVFNSGFDGCP